MRKDGRLTPFPEETAVFLGGEETPFRDVFHSFFPRLRSFFRSYGFSAADAEDLSQATLWNVYRAREQYRAEGTLESWIYATARNAARDEWRQRGRREETDLGADPPEPGAPPDDVLSDKEELSRTVNALLAIPARMRACLLLRVQHGLTYREIGRRLYLSPHTVKVQIWNARRRLKKLREGAP